MRYERFYICLKPKNYFITNKLIMSPDIYYDNMKEQYSKEVLNLAGVNERFNNEAKDVQDIRVMFSNIFKFLTLARDEVWRSEAGRNYALAITAAEDSCIRTVKWIYSND